MLEKETEIKNFLSQNSQSMKRKGGIERREEGRESKNKSQKEMKKK